MGQRWVTKPYLEVDMSPYMTDWERQMAMAGVRSREAYVLSARGHARSALEEPLA